ncbi:hypothetical protein ACS0TY_001969 [Phlomoides rotata]
MRKHGRARARKRRPDQFIYEDVGLQHQRIGEQGQKERMQRINFEGNFNWSFKPSEGRAGGIISIWNSDKFICSSSWFMEGAIVVNGFWKSDDSHCVIINVYAPGLYPKGENYGIEFYLLLISSKC